MSTPNTNLQTYLTEGNFTCDEWNNLLYLFSISHFSYLCCAQNFSLTSCTKTMAKRMQEQRGDNRIVAKSKPTTMNLAASVSTSSSTVNSPIASKSPGILKSTLSNTCRKRSQSRRSVEFSRMAKRCISGREYRETCRDRKRPGTPESLQDIQDIQELQETQKTRKPKAMTKIGHTISIFHQIMCCMEKVFSILRQRCGRNPTDQMKDLDVNTARWRICMSVTLQAAVHLGKDYTENLRSTKNQPLKQLCQVTERLIKDQTEITGLATLD